MKKKLLIGLLLVAVLILAMSFVNQYNAPQEDPEPGEEEPVRTALPISPYASGLPQDGQLVTLYFRFADSAYLGQELRYIDVGLDETLEACIVGALLEGPSADMLDLQSLFASNIQVIATSAQDELLTITLSDTLLQAPPDAPSDWQQYEYWREEIPRRRYLALCSLVNALTEDGRYAQVQLLVAAEGEAQGRRVPRAMFDSGVTDEALLLEPIGRQEDSILTAANAAQYLLRCWQRKDWMALYTMLTAGEDVELPSQTVFLEEMARIESSILNYQASSGSVRLDGAQATVLISGQMVEKNGDTYRLTTYPVCLLREMGTWKLPYDALLRMMRAK